MSKEEWVRELLIAMVPQWYVAKGGPNPYELGGSERAFHSVRPLTPKLGELRRWMNSNFSRWVNELPQTPSPSSYASITEEIALYWLNQHGSVSWDRLVVHLAEAKLRTHENAPVSRNVVISPKAIGQEAITERGIQKWLDGLASSHTFFRVDGALRYLDYDEIALDDVKAVQEYKFHPDFLHPFHGKLTSGDFSAHLTNRGDIVVMDEHGLLAANRRGRWYVYDVQTFKNFLGDILGGYRLGCNIFDVVLDLSYRRHGALLVYDKHGGVLKAVTNKTSIVHPAGTADKLRAMLSSAVGRVSLSEHSFQKRKKRILLEIASMDGAVIFDDRQILAFGAIVRPHDDVESFQGTRTTAAHSAYLWGGTAIKVSADGDITAFFDSEDGNGTRHGARTDFL